MEMDCSKFNTICSFRVNYILMANPSFGPWLEAKYAKVQRVKTIRLEVISNTKTYIYAEKTLNLNVLF
jgi:hypothetical protein